MLTKAAKIFVDFWVNFEKHYLDVVPVLASFGQLFISTSSHTGRGVKTSLL